MKKSFLYLSFIVAVSFGFASCHLSGQNDSTPQILMTTYANLNTDSVMHYGVNSDYTAYTLDTIEVGDTVSIFWGGFTNFNYLTKMYTTISNNKYAKLLAPPDSVKSMFSEESNFETGELYLSKENINYITYIARLVALTPTDKVTLTLGVTNNSTKMANIAEVKIEFPIKAKLEDE